jgi:sulfur relay (sulfurtransferase) DsrF/TusC family protein
MIDFSRYIGKPIVLVTNYTNSAEELFGNMDETAGIELFVMEKRYICVRKLMPEDLKDEDFIPWLNTMWPTEILLTTFLKKSRIWKKRDKA